MELPFHELSLEYYLFTISYGSTIDDISYARSSLDMVQDEYDIINEKMKKDVDYARAEGLKFVSQSFINSANCLSNSIHEAS